MRKLLLLLTILSILTLSGCATKVQNDYSQYLQNNTGQIALPAIERPFGYAVSPATQAHSVSIRSWMAGIANSWDVRFNDILLATLNSYDVRKAIPLHPEMLTDTDKIYFDLVSYEFADTRATIRLRIDTTLAGGTKLSKTYDGQGLDQGGKMFWGGAFAMKNAVQQSSKIAMDQILTAYFNDLNAAIGEEKTKAEAAKAEAAAAEAAEAAKTKSPGKSKRK